MKYSLHLYSSAVKKNAGLLRLALGAALLGLAPDQAAAKQLPSVNATTTPAATLNAKPAIGGHSFSNNGFESPQLATAGTYQTGNFTNWTVVNTAGLANHNSTYTTGSPPPFGTQVGFIASNSSLSSSWPFPSTGYWRARFYAAQRRTGTTTTSQQLRFSLDGSQVYAETPVGSPDGELGGFREYFTTPVYLASGNHTFRFHTSGAAGVVLLDRIQFERILPWNAASSWMENRLPVNTDHVRIGSNSSIVLNAAAASAKFVTVEGELLAGANDGIGKSLNAQWVLVMGGVFEVGKPEFPYTGNFTLTLAGGNASAVNYSKAGTNFLMAHGGGIIDLHGTSQKSWTRLAATANTSASQVTLAEAVAWNIGDELVIAPSTIKYDEAEIRTITAKTVNNKTLTLNQTLSGKHLGIPAAYANSKGPQQVDLRAEVGLLTHNVKVLGGTATTDGAHVMIMQMANCTMCANNGSGIGRFSSVEFNRVGQKQRLARYPVHWHMLHEDPLLAQQFIRGCSVRNSFNRAITLHGTSYVTVEDNVACGHIGHGIFLEDGSERFNKVLRNLVIGSRQAAVLPGYTGANDPYNYDRNEAVLPSDNMPPGFKMRSPAAFWITNPNNQFEGNVAAGTEGTAYWFALPKTGPLGLSASDPRYDGIIPITEPLGTFKDNTAHSCGMGLLANDSIDPATNEVLRNNGWNPAGGGIQEFTGFRIYSTVLGLYTGLGKGLIMLNQTTLADNYEHIFFADATTVINSLLVKSTGNNLAPLGAFGTADPYDRYGDKYAAYVAYDGPGNLRNSHLAGFHGTDAELVRLNGAAMRHTNHRFSGLSYNHSGLANFAFPDVASLSSDLDINTQHPYRSNYWGISLMDEDGTLTRNAANAGHSLITNHPLMQCKDDVTFTTASGAFQKISSRKFGYLNMRFFDAADTNIGDDNMPDVTFKRTWGRALDGTNESNRSLVYTPKIFARQAIPVIVLPAGGNSTADGIFTYACIFSPSTAVASPPTIRKIEINLGNLSPGDLSPVIGINGTLGLNLNNLTFSAGAGNWTSTTNLNNLKNTAAAGSNAYFKDTTNGILYLRYPIDAGDSGKSFSIKW